MTPAAAAAAERGVVWLGQRGGVGVVSVPGQGRARAEGLHKGRQRRRRLKGRALAIPVAEGPAQRAPAAPVELAGAAAGGRRASEAAAVAVVPAAIAVVGARALLGLALGLLDERRHLEQRFEHLRLSNAAVKSARY